MLKIKNWDYHDKLVRNKIPEIIEKDGNKTVLYRILDDDKEYKKYLFEKLYEEYGEAKEAAGCGYESDEYNEDKLIEELADIFEVMESIIDIYNIDLSRISSRAFFKKQSHGNFSGRILLVEVLEHEKTND